MFSRLMVIHLVLGMICLGLSASPALAERIWDDDLKRYLTEQEMMQAEVYLTEEDALKLMFPTSERIRQETLSLNPDQKKIVEDRIGWRFPEESFPMYIGETGKKIDGYALVQHTIGKHKPMTYMVGVDADGNVTNVELLIFRESRGSEVRTKRFNSQYEGKTVLDPVRINRDIINISGATMSVRSMSAGVKRMLVLVDEFYLKPLGRGSDVRHAKRDAEGFWGSLFGK